MKPMIDDGEELSHQREGMANGKWQMVNGEEKSMATGYG
jgi:hypothetical protein